MTVKLRIDWSWLVYSPTGSSASCFWSSAAWPPTSCTWTFPFFILGLNGEPIPPCFTKLNKSSPPPPQINPPVFIKPPGGLNRGFTVFSHWAFEQVFTIANSSHKLSFIITLLCFSSCKALCTFLALAKFEKTTDERNGMGQKWDNHKNPKNSFKIVTR